MQNGIAPWPKPCSSLHASYQNDSGTEPSIATHRTKHTVVDRCILNKKMGAEAPLFFDHHESRLSSDDRLFLANQLFLDAC
jgi:hypothetical protein